MFRPGVNLLVGDQGSGKSSVYQAICTHGLKKKRSLHLPDKDKVPFVMNYKGDPMPVFAFDFEKDNYRTKAYFDDDIGFHVGSMYKSHGEMVLALMDSFEEIDRAMIVLFDEPDMALSIRSCYRLVRIFKHLADLGGQVIATAHNPTVILGFPEVYSLEHHEWMPSADFVATQMEEAEAGSSNG